MGQARRAGLGHWSMVRNRRRECFLLAPNKGLYASKGGSLLSAAAPSLVQQRDPAEKTTATLLHLYLQPGTHWFISTSLAAACN